MRLGQLAKKHDIPVKEIMTYLEEHTGEKFHPNAKIYDALESKVFDHFGLQPETTAEVVEESNNEILASEEVAIETEEVSEIPKIEKSPFPATPEEEIAMLDGELAEAEELPKNEDANPRSAQPKEAKAAPAEDEVIQTDKLLELLESEELPEGLDKIKLIKASKKELSGLKVVGKVDLPEPKKKEEKQSDIVTEKDLREYRNPRKKRHQLTDEEKEKRRLKAKQKKEAYEVRLEKRRKEQEELERKTRKEEHYKQKLEQAKAIQVKQKTKQQESINETVSENQRPEPKTMLGKFWKWMNT
ncbi:hypothetical protein [Ekhidna sp. To15]|uniref:hypothetical protein n=1 Tax=Ekhidna sp. To15 TaxID=3395267 RepID=UPI003F51AD37